MQRVTAQIDARISAGIEKFQPILCKARLSKKNESDTVTIITDIFHEVFGFDKYEQITSELPIKHTFCDLAIVLDGKVALLIECKGVTVDLREEHVTQATGYAANSGIDYVILTNGIQWRIYQVVFGKPVETVLVCSFDFCELNVNRPDDLAVLRSLCVESFDGGENAAIGQLHTRRGVLNRYIVGQLLLNDWMIDTIRRSLERHFPAVKITDSDVWHILSAEVFRPEITQGDQADKAAQTVAVADARMKEVQRASRK